MKKIFSYCLVVCMLFSICFGYVESGSSVRAGSATITKKLKKYNEYKKKFKKLKKQLKNHKNKQQDLFDQNEELAKEWNVCSWATAISTSPYVVRTSGGNVYHVTNPSDISWSGWFYYKVVGTAYGYKSIKVHDWYTFFSTSLENKYDYEIKMVKNLTAKIKSMKKKIKKYEDKSGINDKVLFGDNYYGDYDHDGTITLLSNTERTELSLFIDANSRKNITVTSSDESVVSIVKINKYSEVVVATHNPGTAILTATAIKSGKKDKLTVIVEKRPVVTNYSVKESSGDIYVGDSNERKPCSWIDCYMEYSMSDEKTYEEIDDPFEVTFSNPDILELNSKRIDFLSFNVKNQGVTDVICTFASGYVSTFTVNTIECTVNGNQMHDSYSD